MVFYKINLGSLEIGYFDSKLELYSFSAVYMSIVYMDVLFGFSPRCGHLKIASVS